MMEDAHFEQRLGRKSPGLLEVGLAGESAGSLRYAHIAVYREHLFGGENVGTEKSRQNPNSAPTQRQFHQFWSRRRANARCQMIDLRTRRSDGRLYRCAVSPHTALHFTGLVSLPTAKIAILPHRMDLGDPSRPPHKPLTCLLCSKGAYTAHAYSR
jgi:hypothetical protein